MNALITIQSTEFNDEPKQAVNARELHGFLEVGKDFTTWIRNRISEYGFIENQDFVIAPQIGGAKNQGRGGHNRTEYFLSLDMAKELSMVERNDKGKQARQYFIECERQAKAVQTALPDFSNPAIAARAWADQVEQNQQKQERLAEVEPKAAALDLLAERKGAVNITLAAKELKTSRTELIQWLEANKWIYSRNHSRQPIVTASYAENMGYMIQTAGVSTHNGQPYTQALITHKGKARLAVILSGGKL